MVVVTWMADIASLVSRGTDPDATRRLLLQAAYAEILRHGYQAASLTRILQDTGLTKGALYHHFDNKRALGFAVIDEVIAPMVHRYWIAPLARHDGDPIGSISECIGMAAGRIDDETLRLGCPLNNLAQEMSPIDEGFRQRIGAVFAQWRLALANALEQGVADGVVVANIDPEAVSIFLVAALEGCLGMAKTTQDRDMLLACGSGILDYLERLRINS